MLKIDRENKRRTWVEEDVKCGGGGRVFEEHAIRLHKEDVGNKVIKKKHTLEKVLRKKITKSKKRLIKKNT